MYDLSPKVVVDANVFIKIFAPEPDSQTAREFLSFCNQNDIVFIAPTLFEYEVIGVCVQKGVDLDKLLSSLNVYYKANLSLYEPTLDDWQLATKICQDGNAKSGYPSMYDSIYQAMAINRNITFVSADTRHIAKANKHGNVCALAEWRGIFKHF